MQLKVFISSRLAELEEERAAVEGAISELWTHENLPFTVWSWESAKAIPTGRPPHEVQSDGVRDSDIYVLILGSEYGDFKYVESPTHKEYDIACSEIGEDCILIYIKEVARREEKLEKWMEEIKNKHAFKSFVNPYQLKDLVKTRLRALWNRGRWKASMPTIQSVLRKGGTFDGDFFKKEPEWIDFEEGFVIERREVDEIIKKLENDTIQLVLGEPASGKSVILKYIGFKLAKENKDVYVMELKKHSGDEVKRYFDDISGIKDERAVFIVDDAHLLPAECERLVREFKNRKLKAKLVIGSRETREIRGERPKEASEFEYLSETDIRAEDVTEEMIWRFLKKIHHFSDERMERVSKNLERYKKDLWHLSWALKAYDPEKDSVEEKEIYERIKGSISEIKVEELFLPLSVFYRFEIPVERDFLEEQLGIEENKINQLIELSEIIETEEIGRNQMLSLIHSSIADLYFKTYQVYPSLGRKVKKEILNLKDADLEYCLFYKYMTNTDPRNATDVVAHLRWRGEKGGMTLLKKLIGDERIEKSIKESIEKEEDVLNIGRCVSNIAATDKEAARGIVNRINIDTLLAKIEKEGVIVKIGWCVHGIVNADKEVGLKLFDSVLSKIEKEENIGMIRVCVRDIAWASKEVGLMLADYINIDTLSSKIEQEKDIGKVGLCVKSIAEASEKVGLKLANHINIDTLSSKIEQEEDIQKIGYCLRNIAWGSKEVALDIANRPNPKIREELLKGGWMK